MRWWGLVRLAGDAEVVLRGVVCRWLDCSGKNGKIYGKGMTVARQRLWRGLQRWLGGCPSTITPLGTGHSECVPFKHKACSGRERGVS